MSARLCRVSSSTLPWKAICSLGSPRVTCRLAPANTSSRARPASAVVPSRTKTLYGSVGTLAACAVGTEASESASAQTERTRRPRMWTLPDRTAHHTPPGADSAALLDLADQGFLAKYDLALR